MHEFTSLTHDYGPVAFDPFLNLGANEIRVELIDRVGRGAGESALWLVPTVGEVRGVVVDSRTGLPIANMGVGTPDFPVGDCTDGEGRFSLLVPLDQPVRWVSAIWLNT